MRGPDYGRLGDRRLDGDDVRFGGESACIDEAITATSKAAHSRRPGRAAGNRLLLTRAAGESNAAVITRAAGPGQEHGRWVLTPVVTTTTGFFDNPDWGRAQRGHNH
jgi:hypothetical protein